MGLDQYAYIKAETTQNENGTAHEPEFTWRKHARLQEFMEKLWHET